MSKLANETTGFNLEEYKEKLIRGSVWFADLGENNGSIQAGIRPVIIVSNSMCNKFSPVVSVVALTSRVKRGLPTHIYLNRNVTMLKSDSIALCEQVLSINKKQIIGYVSQLESKYIELIDGGLRKQLELESEAYAKENADKEKKYEEQAENFSFEYAQEIINTIEEAERLYNRLQSDLLINMIKENVKLLIDYCNKFNKACELYKKKYSRYLKMDTKQCKGKLIISC